MLKSDEEDVTENNKRYEYESDQDDCQIKLT